MTKRGVYVKISILNRTVVAVVFSAAWLVGMSMPAHAQGQSQQEHQQKQDKKQKKQQPQARHQQQRAQQGQRQRQSGAVANNHGNNGFHGNGNNGHHYGRISDEHYRAHFGRDHSFRMMRPRKIKGYNRFQYNGYWFGYNQPWPSNWGRNDNVYVEYSGGGYYLYNPRHSGIRITLNLF